MPSSSPTPTRHRKSSSIAPDLSFTSANPQSNDYCAKRPSNSRRSSQYIVASPPTPRPTSLHDTSGYFESSVGFDDLGDPGNANSLGNLADELAEAFDEEDDNRLDFGDDVSETLHDRAEAIRYDHLKENEHPTSRNGDRKGHAISVSPVRQATSDLSLSPIERPFSARHKRKNSQYDGSDYGDDSDLDGLSPSLEARLAAVESLVRRGTEANGSDADEIVQRVADSLKDLGSQAGVENGATR